MKRPFLFPIILIASLILPGCAGGGAAAFTCSDPLGCVEIKSGEAIKIATVLTMSGPDAVYGIDAVRGVEIAISDAGKLLGHPIELIKEDDRCEEAGGQEAATLVAQNGQIVGAIGATCSSATVPAAKILTEAGMVLISPSSTAPSLTDPASHQAGFLRSIYNDKAQGKSVAEFAFNVLGLRRMVTIHDGTPYPQELQAAACESFVQLGGDCLAQIQLSPDQNMEAVLQNVIPLDPDVIYFPLYTVDGVAVTKGVTAVGLTEAALMSSDGLISPDFIEQTQPASEGMYLSGPADVEESEPFIEKYKAAYGEDPIASYHLQAYDAANMLFYAIQQSAQVSGDSLFIERQKLRDALYSMHGIQGLSGTLTCSPVGDCAAPNIEIFQIVHNDFVPIFP
jgi:branched-chain amino acid transport system substrate-binding protein